MTVAILLIVSLFAGLLGTVLRKYFINENNSGVGGGFLFNAVSTLIAGAILFLWGGVGEVSLYTVLLGIIFGILTAVQGITNLLAIETGPLSYTTVIISCSTIISALSGRFFFGEELTPAHIVGILLMIVSFVLATDKNGKDKKATWKWLVYCLVAFFSTGFIGVMQKIHQNSDYKDQLNLFLVVAFAVSALLCTVFAVFFLGKKTKLPSSRSKKRLAMVFAVMVVCGICTAINNKFNLYLSGVMDSAVFFPIVNGGGLILTTVSAFILFKERFSKKQWCGIVFGILSVVFLCNPF